MSSMKFGRCKDCMDYKYITEKGNCVSCQSPIQAKIKMLSVTPSPRSLIRKELFEETVQIKPYQTSIVEDNVTSWVENESRKFVTDVSFNTDDQFEIEVIAEKHKYSNHSKRQGYKNSCEATLDQITRVVSN